MDNEIKFFCHSCKTELWMDFEENVCRNCKKQIVIDDNIFNLTLSSEKTLEKDYYNSVYKKTNINPQKITLKKLDEQWSSNLKPENVIIRKILGNLKNKKILLTGNGASWKELAFLLDKPNRLIYSDLSPYASMAVKKNIALDQYNDLLRFAVIDAEDLPFEKCSFDILYGYAMVHHLPNIGGFLQGAYEVLKPGGMAVFLDDAYSPLWHLSKKTVLRPLMNFSQKKHGISPEDYRFSMSGGFREEDLKKIVEQIGGEFYFEKVSFLDYIVKRAIVKLLPKSKQNVFLNSWIVNLLIRIDRKLGNLSFYKKNQIRLIWGFKRTK